MTNRQALFWLLAAGGAAILLAWYYLVGKPDLSVVDYGSCVAHGGKTGLLGEAPFCEYLGNNYYKPAPPGAVY